MLFLGGKKSERIIRTLRVRLCSIRPGCVLIWLKNQFQWLLGEHPQWFRRCARSDERSEQQRQSGECVTLPKVVHQRKLTSIQVHDGRFDSLRRARHPFDTIETQVYNGVHFLVIDNQFSNQSMLQSRTLPRGLDTVSSAKRQNGYASDYTGYYTAPSEFCGDEGPFDTLWGLLDALKLF